LVLALLLLIGALPAMPAAAAETKVAVILSRPKLAEIPQREAVDPVLAGLRVELADQIASSLKVDLIPTDDEVRWNDKADAQARLAADAWVKEHKPDYFVYGRFTIGSKRPGEDGTDYYPMKLVWWLVETQSDFVNHANWGEEKLPSTFLKTSDSFDEFAAASRPAVASILEVLPSLKREPVVLTYCFKTKDLVPDQDQGDAVAVVAHRLLDDLRVALSVSLPTYLKEVGFERYGYKLRGLAEFEINQVCLSGANAGSDGQKRGEDLWKAADYVVTGDLSVADEADLEIVLRIHPKDRVPLPPLDHNVRIMPEGAAPSATAEPGAAPSPSQVDMTQMEKKVLLDIAHFLRCAWKDADEGWAAAGLTEECN
jgi:hypothetical protein